jgi:hypothetical protein
MGVNSFSFAALVFAYLTGAAVSAPLPVSADLPASIQGRDVRSQFLPGAYVIAPGATDGGSNISASSTGQDVPVFLPVVRNQAFFAAPRTEIKATAPAATELLSANTFDLEFPGSQGGDGGLPSQNTGSGGGGTSVGGSTEGSPNHVGTVPLPPALPLFGAAVLGLAALGRARKRKGATL